MSNHALSRLFSIVISVAAAAAAAPAPAASLDLRTAVELAIAHSPEVAAGRAAADEAAAAARLAAEQMRPEAWLTTTPGYSRGLPTAIAGSVPAVAGVALRQTLYDPARRAELLRRRTEELAAGARAERVRAETIHRAVQSYVRCWTDATLIEQARARQEAAGRILEHATARASDGRATELTVAQLRLHFAKARLATLELEATQDLDRLELAHRIGRPTGAPLPPLEDPAAELPAPGDSDSVAVALESDPDLRAAGPTLDLLRSSAALEGRSFAPVVEAEAQYSRLSSFNHYDRYYRSFDPNTWSIGVSVAVPLWRAGRRGDAAAGADAAVARTTAERAARQSDLELAAHRAESAVDLARARASLSRQGVAVAEDALAVARAQAAEGRGDADEVATREADLAEAQQAAARASLQWLSARIDLLAVRGELAGALDAERRQPPDHS